MATAQQGAHCPRSHLLELLSRVASEVERLETLHQAAVTRSQQLAEENASLSSRLMESRPFTGSRWPAFDESLRPISSQSGAAKPPTCDGSKIRAAAFFQEEGPSLPVLVLPGRNSPPLSVTSTPRTEEATPSTIPEPNLSPTAPPKEPAVLDAAGHAGWQGFPPSVKVLGVPGMDRSERGTRSFDRAGSSFEERVRVRGPVGQFTQRFGKVTAAKPTKEATPWTLHSLVTSFGFDYFFSGLIFCNAIIMALEAQYRGIDLCSHAGETNCGGSAEVTWPGAAEVFVVLGWIFGLLFLLEVVLKIGVLKVAFAKSVWNIFDFIVVFMWVLEKILSSLVLDPMIIRLGRMARLIRLLRMARAIQSFDSLQVLLGSIQASASALLWSTFLLLLIQMIIGLFLHSMLQDFISNAVVPEASRQGVFRYFGTFTRSMISMFELTLANWPAICWTLVNEVSEWYGLLIVAYKLIVGFAVMVIVTGVFLHETFKVASSDDELMLVQKQRATKNHVRKMERLFKEADTSHDGLIDRDEFRSILMVDKVRTWLSAMELEVCDPDTLFDFLDDGDQVITVTELIDGVARLKGTARNIDVVAVMRAVNDIYDLLEDLKLNSSLTSSTDGKVAFRPASLSIRSEHSVGSMKHGVGVMPAQIRRLSRRPNPRS